MCTILAWAIRYITGWCVAFSQTRFVLREGVYTFPALLTMSDCKLCLLMNISHQIQYKELRNLHKHCLEIVIYYDFKCERAKQKPKTK